ncbi:MAG: hypothetical protein FJX78_06255, partial [Armatimonadetes bacterium]|nr:hypothetical protein [Armatimonadota bacterium]
RQEVHDRVLAEAFAVVAEEGLGERPGLVVWGDGWHPGVVGIAAGRLRESFHRPVVLLSVDGDMARGSARSIPGLNLVEALHDSRDLLDRYGGHAAAAGVSLPADRLAAFRDRFEAAVRARVTDEDFVPRVEIDAEVPFTAIDEGLATALDALRPYGAGNPEPVLAVRNVAVADVAALGGGEHLRLLLTDGSSTREAVAFRQGDLGDVLMFTQARVDVAFRLQRRLWQNRMQIQCVVTDLRTPGVDLGAVLTDARALVNRLFDHRADYLGGRGRGAEEATVVRTQLAGERFDHRQDAIGTLAAGDAVTLVREPSNPRDPHAIRVDAAGGESLGYVPRWLAGRLAPEIDRGARYRAIAEHLTGGGDGPRGVDLRIERVEAIDAPERGESDLVRLALADDDATLLRRLAIHVLRGQALDEPNSASVRAVLAGERRIALGPPGSGPWAALVAAAAARAARGSPSVFVFPTVELLALRARWWRSMLAAVGVRSRTLHGLLPVEERDGVLAELGTDRDASGAPDVLFTTAATWERFAAALTSLRNAAVLIGEGWTTPALPPFARAHPGSVLWNAWTTTAADGFAAAAPPRVRTNLRIADRRGSTSGQAVLEALAAGGERTIAFAATAEEAVTVASAFRSADPSRADRIAYDHEGLPPRVRETLYGLLSAGRLSLLVCAGAPGEEARISGVRHLVWLAFPDDWHTFLIQAASAGLGREEATLHVAFGEEEVARARARLEARHPSRRALAALFRVLRSRPTPIPWPDADLAAAVADNGGPAPADIEPALRILVEAGVVRMTGGDGEWRIEVAPADRRYELRDAIAYAEGESSRAAFAFAVARLSRAGAAILEAAAGVAGSPVSDAG